MVYLARQRQTNLWYVLSSNAILISLITLLEHVLHNVHEYFTWTLDRYGCRRVTIMGSILACLGFLLASFSHNIVLLYLFFGAISGPKLKNVDRFI